MRRIPLENLVVTEEWAQTRTDALDAMGKPEADAAKVFTAHQKVWSSLKEAMKALSHDKCWYCESLNIRADNAVDHFRPKSRYPWLAFEWSNYRFACTYCNSRRTSAEGTKGGKADLFPLVDENLRATKAGQEAKELPLLLDPTVDFDVGLIWFEENGTVQPQWPLDEDETLYKRANVSITTYHFPHPELVERRAFHCANVRTIVRDADTQIKVHGAGTQLAREVLDKAVVQLKRMLAPGAEYSAAVRCTLLAMSASSRVAQTALR